MRRRYPLRAAVLRFQGELMLCALCGASERSDPRVESQWRFIEWESDATHGAYVCPAHFPPDRASAAEFEAAYTAVFKALFGARK